MPALRTSLRSALLPLALAACGDNEVPTPPSPPDAAPAPPARAVVVAGTFIPGEAGVMSALSFDPLSVATRVAPNGAVGSDPILRLAGGELFVVNRADGNNVTVLDAATLAYVDQFSTGAGSNPQDVAAWGDKLFVPAFDTAGVVVITRGARTRVTVDLSALDPDGKPNCHSAFAVGEEIYVSCELLDAAFQPRGPGQIAVLDAATNAVKTTFALAGVNPFGVFERAPEGVLGGDLVIPTVPSFSDFSSGCLERVQVGAAPRANGCVVTNAQLGGYISRVAFQAAATPPMLWVVASKFDTAARGNVQGYDLADARLWPAPVTPATQVIVDAVPCAGDLVVADQTMAANGLRVYRDGAERTTAPLAIGLRPGSSHGLVCVEP